MTGAASASYGRSERVPLRRNRSSYGHDHRTIDVTESAQVRYWAVMLNCSVSELRHVVAAAGPVVCDVHNHLRRLTALGFRG